MAKFIRRKDDGSELPLKFSKRWKSVEHILLNHHSSVGRLVPR